MVAVKDISPGKPVKPPTHLHLPTFVVAVRKNEQQQ
jgi:hypothetical protein